MALAPLKAWLTNDGGASSDRQAVIWNALGSGLLTGQAAIVLVFVARTDTLEAAGNVTLAYALATLALAIARFGMRNYQVTDVQERYSFADYRASRYVTTVLTFLFVLAALAVLVFTGAYDVQKAGMVLSIVALKLVDAVEDLYVARHQQIDCFVSGAKACAVHQFVTTVAICIAVVAGIGTLPSFCVGTLVSAVVFAALVRMTSGVRESHAVGDVSLSRVMALLAQCVPLCVGMSLSIYVGNLPKYAIDLYLDNATQAVFGYLMLPVFAVTLLNQFIYQPFVRELGVLWDTADLKKLRRTIVRQCLLVLGIALLVLAAFFGVGLPLLSLLYNVDLSPYRAEFTGLMVGGVIFSLASYLSVPLTVIREQRVVGLAYAAAALLGVLLQGVLVPAWGLRGVIVLYAVCNGALLLSFIAVLILRLRASRRTPQE